MTSLANDRQWMNASAPGIHHPLLNDLCAALFRTLPRRDQRRKGLEYVFGLLAADGRKSIRNIAALFGDQAAEQSLHHFICSSTWDWTPVRHELTRFVVRAAPPRAWVLRPMVIPKAGDHSVGVDRQFFSTVGHVLNAQQAVGVWAASDELRGPVNWRLRLSDTWLEDKDRRAQAAIPDGVASESMDDCAVDALLELITRCDLPVLPTVLDARDFDVTAVMNRLSDSRVPLLARVDGSVRLVVNDPALTGHFAQVLPAHHVMRAARHLRQPVVWRSGGADPRHRIRLTAGVRVRLPRHTPASPRRRDLLLLSITRIGEDWPAQLWLTTMTAADTAALVRLTGLVDEVDRDFADIAEHVGVRDFAGRSYCGWHRHMTLVSAAHVVSALTHRAGVVRQVSVPARSGLAE